jgi:hypothetical protein
VETAAPVKTKRNIPGDCKAEEKEGKGGCGGGTSSSAGGSFFHQRNYAIALRVNGWIK